MATVKLNFDYDKPTQNNRVYPKELLEREINKLHSEGILFITQDAPSSTSVPITNIIGKVTNVVDTNETYEFEVLPIMEEDSYFDNLEVTTSGIGNFDKDNKIIDFKLICLFVTPKRKDEQNECNGTETRNLQISE